MIHVRSLLVLAAAVCIVAAGGCDGDRGEMKVYDEAQVDDIRWAIEGPIESLVTVRWQQLAPAYAHVEYSVDEGPWRSSPPTLVEVGPCSERLLGVLYESDVTFRVVNDFGEGPTVTEESVATAGPLPAGLPLPTVLLEDLYAFAP